MKAHCVFENKEMREWDRERLVEIYIRVTKAEEKTTINKRSIQVTF